MTSVINNIALQRMVSDERARRLCIGDTTGCVHETVPRHVCAQTWLSPWGRTVIIPRLDEEAVVEGEPFFLSGVEFDDGRLQSDLPQLLTEFIREGQTPVWRLAIKGRRIEKRILMPYGQNSVYVQYRLLEGESLHLRIRPFVTFRTLDARLGQANPAPCAPVCDGRYEMNLCEGAPLLKMCLRPQAGVFVADDFRVAGCLSGGPG